MISRRNFFSICTMMAALLFMLQFTQVIRATDNDYNVNESVQTMEILSGADRWQPKELTETGYVVFIGSATRPVGEMVLQWCDYTKRSCIVVSDVDELELPKRSFPELVLIDSNVVDFAEDTDALVSLAEEGVSLVFCTLPDFGVVRENAKLQNLLGIAEVEPSRARTLGIELFPDFFVGGEAVYQVQRREDQDLQDLQLVVPWYRLNNGTKTYMVGLMEIDEEDEDGITREDFPAIIWRNSYGDAMVFAVNGSYMSSLTALGILDAFVYEMEPYQLYPVINARNTVVANYPDLASENAAQLNLLYSRSPEALYRDVMWPGIAAIADRYDLRLTCYMMPQYYYADELEPSGSGLDFYFRQFKEVGVEAGITLEYAHDVRLENKLAQDESFFQDMVEDYQFGTYYTGKKVLGRLDNLLADGELKPFRTLVVDEQREYPLVSYYTDEVTLQCITVNARDYTYSEDLQMRSLITALGYNNILMDMRSVTWPQSVDEEWQNYFDDVSSNIGTYWSRFQEFSSTTLSESDARVRSFLNLDYKESRKDDIITLQVENAGSEAWFVLRTHDEAVVQVEGGTYQKVEANYYLINVLSEHVEITLRSDSYSLDVMNAGDILY